MGEDVGIMGCYEGKKLLIIGGAFQHVKVVETARKMGIITYVADFLDTEDAPAKQIADYAYQINIFDTDTLVNLCKREHIDAVLACNLDICQKPYQEVCEKLGVPCFGTKEQFQIMTDKPAFKKTCTEYGLDVIPELTVDDVLLNKNIDYPIFIKPCESSSSKGQTICYSLDEVPAAIEFAKSQSLNNEVLIEKYMGDKDDFSVSGLMIQGKLYVTRISDRFLGSDKMNKSEIAGVSPSRNERIYKNYVHDRLERMLQGIGLVDAPVFIQGLVDGNTIRFYDPGLRFPGAECEKAFYRMYGINLTVALIEFAFKGYIPEEFKNIGSLKPKEGVYSLLMYFPIAPGKILSVSGEQDILNHPDVVAFCKQYNIGDTVGTYYNAKQRYGEIDVVCNDVNEMKNMVSWIYEKLIIQDEYGRDMAISKFDPERLNCYIHKGRRDS